MDVAIQNKVMYLRHTFVGEGSYTPHCMSVLICVGILAHKCAYYAFGID